MQGFYNAVQLQAEADGFGNVNLPTINILLKLFSQSKSACC